jgi:hypothetical protein
MPEFFFDTSQISDQRTRTPSRHWRIPPIQPHCNITGCGISIAVPQLLDCHRVTIRSRVMVFGGSRRLRA